MIYNDIYEKLAEVILRDYSGYCTTLELPAFTAVNLAYGTPKLDTAMCLNLTIDSESEIENEGTLAYDVMLLNVRVDILVNGSLAKLTELQTKQRLAKYYLAFITMLKANPSLDNTVRQIGIGQKDFFEGVENTNAIKALQFNVGLSYES